VKSHIPRLDLSPERKRISVKWDSAGRRISSRMKNRVSQSTDPAASKRDKITQELKD
jgi:YD repeat-containing protein